MNDLNQSESDKRELEALQIIAGLNESNKLLSSEKPKKSRSELFRIVRLYKDLLYKIVCWKFRQSFLKLIDDFLEGNINADSFCREYFKLRLEIASEKIEISRKIEEEIPLVNELYYTPEADNFSDIFSDLIFIVDLYTDDLEEKYDDLDLISPVYGEKTLKLAVKTQIFPKLEKYYLPFKLESYLNRDNEALRSTVIFFAVVTSFVYSVLDPTLINSFSNREIVNIQP